MMGKKYQLVAWTRNVTDPENARLNMIPSLEWEIQEPYFREITRCQQEEKEQGGFISLSLARRFVRAYEQNARFEFLTGHSGQGIRWLCKAALYCIWEDGFNWAYWDTDLGSYSCFCGELRHEFTKLCREAVSLAKKYSREDVLLEKEPSQMLEFYLEHTQEERDLQTYLKDVSCYFGATGIK